VSDCYTILRLSHPVSIGLGESLAMMPIRPLHSLLRHWAYIWRLVSCPDQDLLVFADDHQLVKSKPQNTGQSVCYTRASSTVQTEYYVVQSMVLWGLKANFTTFQDSAIWGLKANFTTFQDSAMVGSLLRPLYSSQLQYVLCNNSNWITKNKRG
jgi:hypothetical protein